MNKNILIGISIISGILFFRCTSSNIEKGNICLSLGDYPMAIEFFDREVHEHPDNYKARIGLGKAFLQKAVDNQNDTISWKKALVNLEAARTINPDSNTVILLSQVWAEYSQRLITCGDTIHALEALSSALQYDPDNIELINQAGILYFRLDYSEKAAILFKRAIDLDSLHAYSFFNLGMVYWSQKDVIKARELWLQALSLDSEDEDILYWFAHAEKKIRESN